MASDSILPGVYCAQLLVTAGRAVGHLNEALCAEQRVPQVDEQGRRKSASRTRVMAVTRELVLCHTMMFYEGDDISASLLLDDRSAITLASGTDLGGREAVGPGPRPPTIEGPPTKLLLFYFLLMNQLMTSL